MTAATLKLGRMVDDVEVQRVEDVAVAVWAEVVHAAAEQGEPAVRAVAQRDVGGFAGGQDAGVKVVGDAHGAHGGLGGVGATGGVGEQDRGLA